MRDFETTLNNFPRMVSLLFYPLSSSKNTSHLSLSPSPFLPTRSFVSPSSPWWPCPWPASPPSVSASRTFRPWQYSTPIPRMSARTVSQPPQPGWTRLLLPPADHYRVSPGRVGPAGASPPGNRLRKQGGGHEEVQRERQGGRGGSLC